MLSRNSEGSVCWEMQECWTGDGKCSERNGVQQAEWLTGMVQSGEIGRVGLKLGQLVVLVKGDHPFQTASG